MTKLSKGDVLSELTKCTYLAMHDRAALTRSASWPAYGITLVEIRDLHLSEGGNGVEPITTYVLSPGGKFRDLGEVTSAINATMENFHA